MEGGLDLAIQGSCLRLQSHRSYITRTALMSIRMQLEEMLVIECFVTHLSFTVLKLSENLNDAKWRFKETFYFAQCQGPSIVSKFLEAQTIKKRH